MISKESDSGDFQCRYGKRLTSQALKMTFMSNHTGKRKKKQHHNVLYAYLCDLQTVFWTNRRYHNKYSKEDGRRNVRATENQQWAQNCDNTLLAALCSLVSVGLLGGPLGVRLSPLQWLHYPSFTPAKRSVFRHFKKYSERPGPFP